MSQLKENGIGKAASYVLQVCIILYFLLFSFGTSFREIFSWLSLAAVLLIWTANYKHSVVAINPRIIFPFIALWLWFVFKSIYSISPASGIYAVTMNLNMGIALFFAGVEISKHRKALEYSMLAVAICVFIQGVNGVYQYALGYDYIDGTRYLGRLTSAFATYRVGNLMSLYLPLLLTLYYFKETKISKRFINFFVLLVAIPGVFLLIGSETRSAYVGTLVSLYMAYIFIKGWSWRLFTLLIVGVITLAIFGPDRVSYQQVLSDGRIKELWPYAWQVFMNHPITGVGLNSWNVGVHALGLKFMMHNQDIAHPHNIYLQILAETGIVGAILFVYCKFGYVLMAMRTFYGRREQNGINLKFLAIVTSVYIGYLATGLSAHNLFRTWWLGTSNLLLGIIVGLIILNRDVQKRKINNKPKQGRKV